MEIVVGTRGSALATAQANHVAGMLRARGHDVRLEVIETRGDRERHATIPELGGKGLFTAELEQALGERRVNVAVHSLKDLPTEDAPGLVVAAVPAREDPRDALVGGRLAELAEGARVGTASLRRRALLLARRPDLAVMPLRGNVGTRIRKVRDGELDAVVLAAAGLARLGRADEIAERLDFLPAPAQGALGIQCRSGDADVRSALAELGDPAVSRCTRAERELLRVLEGGCSVPVGALATCDGGTLRLRGLVAALDGSRVLEADGSDDDPVALGRMVAKSLLDEGAKEILDAAR